MRKWSNRILDKGLCWILFNCVFVTVAFGAMPLCTDDAGVVEKAKYELESGCDITSDEQFVNIGFKHGLTDRMDIGVFLPLQTKPKKDDVFCPAGVCMKFMLVKDMFSFSFVNEFGEPDYVLNGIFSREFSLLKLHLNLGYEYIRNSGEKGEISYSGALEFPFKNIDIVGEMLNKEGVLLGGRIHIKDCIALDTGCNIKNQLLTVGLHYEF
ncbi:MAG: hypothetical protein PHX21_07925 [bacterium]|nr:hypothetical protein [bacterium]